MIVTITKHRYPIRSRWSTNPSNRILGMHSRRPSTAPTSILDHAAQDWGKFYGDGVAPSEHVFVIATGWLTTISRFARKMGATVALAAAVASVPWATPSAPSRAASLTIQGNTAPLGVVAAKQGGGQLVGENRDHDVRPTPKKATASGGESSVVDPPAPYAPIARVAAIAAIARDSRALHFLPEQTGPPVD